MDNFNLDELMDLAEAYVGPMVDAIYRRLIERDFALEDPEVVMLLTALINILGHDNRGDRPTEVLLMAAYGERGVLDRPNMRVMRWRNGALSGSDLANEPGLGSSRTYQPGEMPMPSKPKPGLTRMHREMNSEATSSGSPLRAAVPPKGAKVTQKVQTNQTIQDLDEMNDQLRSTKKELDDMTKTMLAMEEDRDMWRKLFEDCNKKQGQEIERLRQEYKERSEQVAVTTSIEKVISARDIPRGQSPMELLTPREMSQTTETRLPAETNRVTIPDPSDTLGDPVVEQTVRKLIETAGRLVANKNAPGSGVTAPYGTIDDTGRVQLSQTVIRQGMSNVTPLMGNSRIPERKVRKMPAKKVSRVIDVQKNNLLKYNFTGVPETDPRACFNRATWSPAVNLQQPPLGTSHLILGDSLVRVLSNLRTSWVTTVMAFGGATIAQLYRMVELMNPGKIPNVMITASKSKGEDKVELPGWGPEDWVKPGSCLAEVCGLEGHVCGSLDCVKTLEKQHKQLTVLFGNVVMRARTETELIADCHGGTDVNLVTALGFYSMFGSLESLLNLEQKHEMVTAISVEVFPGVLQTEQKYIGKWREAIETEMNIRHSETYCRPSGARYLVGSTLAPMCKSRYPVHFVAVDVKSTRTIVDQAFSVPKCVRLARMSEKSYELLCKMFSAVPERTKEELESILGKKFMGYVSGNFSDFEKQKQRGSTVTDYNAVDENDEIHRVMMEVEALLEASGKRNWRSIMLTHDEFPCHCLLQTWWYPKRSNLVLIWDSGELLSMGLPDSSQPITIVIVGVMMAIRWLEAHVRENNRQEAPTREQLQKLDCLKDLDRFETMCKVLNIPMEVKKIWARKRLMSWFRANMTAWLYEYAKKHMSKHGRVYSEYQLDIGAGAFKRAFVTHRNAVTTAVKRISRTSERSGNEKAEMLKEDLERNVTLCLHNSFCRNRESNVDPLPCCKQRVEEQKCWRTASNSVRIVNDVLQDTETESAESVSQEEEMEH